MEHTNFSILIRTIIHLIKPIQFNLSNADTFRTKTIDLISEVFLFQGKSIYIKLGLSRVS